MSEAEAERLGGTTPAPPRDEVEWTNPRTGLPLTIDRGLDPSWAGNPGRDRPRLLAEMLARKIDDAGELTAALAREQLAQILASPLLERQLAATGREVPPLGDLAVAYLESRWRRALGVPQVAIRLPSRAAGHVAGQHGLSAGQWRAVLPLLAGEPELVGLEKGWKGRDFVDLVFAARPEGKWWKLIVRKSPEGGSIASLYRATDSNVSNLAKRETVDVLLDRR